MERYPEDTTVSLEDFRNCGWLETIREAGREDYTTMWQVLSSAASKAIENEKFSEGKVLWLLADACSMMLKPSSLNEPFRPLMVMGDKRSALPEDFKKNDVEFFSEIVDEINDPKLCARVSDITWLLKTPRDPKFALIAIDNYIQIPLNKESWVRDGNECWERAIQLCIMLGKGAGEMLKRIETTIGELLQKATIKDGYLTKWIADLFAKHKLGGIIRKVIPEKLEKLATEFENEGQFRCSIDYLDSAIYWYKRLENSEKSTEMTVRVAKAWEKEAQARQTADLPSNMVAASFYEKAIQKYRTIPKDFRNNYDVDNRILKLRTKMNAAGEQSLKEMGVVSSGQIDISDLVERSKKAVCGKSKFDALLSLANIYNGAKTQKIREISEKMIHDYIVHALFPATYISKDGRVIAKSPGAYQGSDNNEGTIWHEMVKHYIMELGIVAQGDIWPALEVIRQEHRIREEDFYSFVRQSPIVPEGREQLIAKALFSGYDNDFITALHILVPQIEHLVRYHLKLGGVKTTSIDVNGIENENGLSALMEKSEVKTIFGEDLAFELKALFCDPFGPNLRNELAHGLIGYNESQSVYSIYTWWLMLRMVFNTFWNARLIDRKSVDSNENKKLGEV